MKKKIIEYLVEKGIYHEGYDLLIKLLVDQIGLYNRVNKAIKDEGITVAGNADGTFFIRNQHFKSLQEIIGTINALTRKLALSPKDFKDLGLVDEEDNDGFGEV